ncbi:hypothetical protein KKD19_05925 [Patescibacteria group bacterium]|nr:hypothetical protein [Patescibacteria group bacterium]MBU4512742.1 hypothetical protein [Patescibacteria group bacterium]MCG2693082.1 hypothetical protein [Candidatus Parcubacteria bacterium]
MELSKLKITSKKLLIFKKETLRDLEPNEDALNENIKYWLKNGELIQLKKGTYVLKDRFEKERQKELYLEYLAVVLVTPAYLSLEYVLDKYQILSEPIRVLTLISSKSTREISNKLGIFRYYSITPNLFCGYRTRYFIDAPIFEASKEKALFDYIYLRFLKNKAITKEAIESLRLNWENISRKEFQKAVSFLKFTPSRKVKEAFEAIKKLYYA